MSWHILGAGSLGGLWAARLSRAGIDTRLILRSQARLEQYQKSPGLGFVEQGQLQYLPIPAQLPSADEPIQLLLLACKAYDALTAVESLAPRLNANSTIVLLQNGLGSQEQVRQALPNVRCVALSSTEGAYRQADYHIVFAGAGNNWLGDQGPRPYWLKDLSAAGIAHQWCDDIETRLWRKFAINCAINPLTVLQDCHNGELLKYPEQLQILCAELCQLLQHCGQSSAGEGLHEQVITVLQGTSANVSSMLQDVRAQRRTEIGYLLGYAYQQAQQRALQLPQIEALYQSLCLELQRRGLPHH